MKTVKIQSYLRLAVAAALSAGACACSENSWNNDLDGFKELEDQPMEDVQTVEYTLTDANYGTIAGLADNKALAGEDGAAALAAVGSKKCFTPEAPAATYVPAFLASTNFPYFTLTEGSAVKLTFNQSTEADPVVAEASAPQRLTVPDEFYMESVWESEDDYINAFAPSRPAADYLVDFLMDEADATDGRYAVISYKVATQEPVFGGGSQPAGPQVLFEQSFTEDLGSFTIDNVKMPEELSYVWTWAGSNYGAAASGYLSGTSYATESWLVSPEIDLSGVSAAELVFDHVVNQFPDLDFAKQSCTLWGRAAGGQWQPIAIPAYSENKGWTFVSSGTISLSAFEGKKMQFAFKYTSEDGRSGKWEIKNLVLSGIVGDNAPASRAAVNVPVESRNAVYYYNGSAWTVPSDFVVLQPSTYSEMGQSYQNLSTAEPYLSTYLRLACPYAQEGDIRYVLWLHYASGATAYDCTKYIFDGSDWKTDSGIETVTEQFVRTPEGWVYSPNVTINLPAGKNQELSTKYFQACVDWVYENICVPLGDTSIKSGKYYVSSYGNNEYYSGTSAYQGNVDLRASAARAQYPTEYDSMTDDEIVALEKSRFMNEVMPGALATLHPEAKPVGGVDVLYTINFSAYTGTTTAYTAVFRVVDQGKFEPVSCTWDE